MLKNLLLKVRWGNELTKEDLKLAEGLTFWEILTSSYLTPKTIFVKFDRNMRRR